MGRSRAFQLQLVEFDVVQLVELFVVEFQLVQFLELELFQFFFFQLVKRFLEFVELIKSIGKHVLKLK